MTAVIETDKLTKWYGKHRGILDIDLTVERGEIFGFLGPNGAGKTTTIRILLDLIRPTAGRALVFGIESSADPIAIHRRVGYIPGEFTLYDRLTGGQTLEYFANLRGGVDPAYQASLIERFELDPSRRFGEYSKGNKQKVGLIIALQHRPELLVLDEPTAGLSPAYTDVVWNQIEGIAQTGTGVLVVEQNVERALKHATFVHIFVAGSNHVHGTAADIASLDLAAIFLGRAGADH